MVIPLASFLALSLGWLLNRVSLFGQAFFGLGLLSFLSSYACPGGTFARLYGLMEWLAVTASFCSLGLLLTLLPFFHLFLKHFRGNRVHFIHYGRKLFLAVHRAQFVILPRCRRFASFCIFFFSWDFLLWVMDGIRIALLLIALNTHVLGLLAMPLGVLARLFCLLLVRLFWLLLVRLFWLW